MVDLIFGQAPGDRLVTSFLAAVELAGAAKRLRKNRILNDAAAAEIVSRLKEDMVSLFEITPALLI